jgi:glycosyltransferase involved in cell wall biosynthesis
MRILLSSFISNERFSGMGRWSHNLAKELEHLGHQTTLWFAEDFPLIRRTGRLSVVLFPVALAFRLWCARARFDAVVIHEPGGLWYGLLRRLMPWLPPMTLICHNVESKVFGEMIEAARRGCAVVSLGTRIKTPLFRQWQTNGAIRLADAVVCLSSFDREYVFHHLGRAERVTLMSNGVANEFFQTHKEKGSERVLFVGGWLDVKGRRVLPSLWSAVLKKFPRACLTIVGSGESAEGVLADFTASDRPSVNVIPRLKEESDMLAQYSSHDVFLMPSLSEGSPLSLLEAMASGLPVVAARVGGVSDIVTHGRDGLLFESLNPSDGAEQICRLLASPKDAECLAVAGRERAHQQTWSASAQVLLSAIESMVSPMAPTTGSFERASVSHDGEVFSRQGASE